MCFLLVRNGRHRDEQRHRISTTVAIFPSIDTHRSPDPTPGAPFGSTVIGHVRRHARGCTVELDYPGIIENESARIVAALAANRTGRVPWSDRWTVGSCAKHVGRTHHAVTLIVRDRPEASFGVVATLSVPDTSDPGLGAWVAEGTSTMVDQLRRTDGQAVCWSWHPAHARASFCRRRMAHETLVHRWDAETGAGVDVQAMRPEVAADAFDEYLDIFATMTRGLSNSPAGPTIGFDATDSGDRWFLSLPAPGQTIVQTIVQRDPLECDITLRGSAEALLLF